MTDDPNIVADALERRCVYGGPAGKCGDCLKCTAARLLRESAGTADRLAELTAAINGPRWLEWWTGALADIPETLKIRLVRIADALAADALAAAVSPTPTPDNADNGVLPQAATLVTTRDDGTVTRTTVTPTFTMREVYTPPDNDPAPTKEALDEVVSISDELGMYDNDPAPAERCPTCGSDSRTMLISEGPVGCWTRNHHPWHD